MPLFGPPNVEKLGARRDIAGLAKALAYKKDWKVRTAAARALGDIGAPAVEPLIAALKDNGLSGVREAAAEALGKIGDPRAVEPLIAALKDGNSDVRKAAEALGKIGDPRAVEPLIAALIHGLSYYREAAAEALVKIGAPAVEPLIAALKGSGMRKAAEALVKIGAPAVEPLIAALKDGDFDVRKAAAGALGEIGWKPDKGEAGALYLIARGKWDECVKIGAPAVEPLIAALKDGNSDVRKAAAEALGKIGWKPDKSEAGAHYLIAQGKWDECVKIGAPAVEPLIAALKDGDSDVRNAAAGALGKIGWKPDKSEAGAHYLIAQGKWDECVKIGAPAVEPLIAALKGRDSDVRPAAGALAKIGAPAVEPLIAALKDPNSDVRKAAAGALGVIGDARAVRPLIAALEGSGMRQAAVNALVRLNNEGRLGDAERSLIHGLGQRYVG
jgi:HEAT repeat protein